MHLRAVGIHDVGIWFLSLQTYKANMAVGCPGRAGLVNLVVSQSDRNILLIARCSGDLMTTRKIPRRGDRNCQHSNSKWDQQPCSTTLGLSLFRMLQKLFVHNVVSFGFGSLR